MKSESAARNKQLYKELRGLSFERLWEKERVAFDAAGERERMSGVALVRALCAAAEGDVARCEILRPWVVGLLGDKLEKVRRYAVNALPRLGSGVVEERALLGLLARTTIERERECILEALGKIGGEDSLRAVSELAESAALVKQRLVAGHARRSGEGRIVTERVFGDGRSLRELRIHLHCRRGLEKILSNEVRGRLYGGRGGGLIVRDVFPELVVLEAKEAFSLRQLLDFRCWHSMGFVLGKAGDWERDRGADVVAGLVSSALAREICSCFTDGAARYRIEMIDRGSRRGFVRELVEKAALLTDQLINDSRQALWSVDISPPERQGLVELRPRFVPDPRFSYRVADIPAASHPPLAAALAMMAQLRSGDVVWDPFCGSGVELAECGLFKQSSLLVGTDLSDEALDAAKKNLRAAGLKDANIKLFKSDFRHAFRLKEIAAGVDVIISNPPMGRRVPIPHLPQMINELLSIASRVLKPRGRLIFVNPVNTAVAPGNLQRIFCEKIDMGGFDAWLEVYEIKKSVGFFEGRADKRDSETKGRQFKKSRELPQKEFGDYRVRRPVRRHGRAS